MSEESSPKAATPPKQSVIAVVSGVLGLISIFIGIFMAVPAVILGHIAFVQIGQSAGKLKGRGMAIFALLVGYITIAMFVFRR